MIEVLEPGFATSVQDEGRRGHYARGIGPSGAMDLYSYRLGNALVGNPSNSASLEFTFTGPKLRFGRKSTFAITGGEAPVFLNGDEVPMWTEVHALPDDVLHFGFLKSGVRGYVSINGGLDVPEFLGSRSTHVLCGLGGLEGRTLQAGDVLPLGSGEASRPAGRALTAQFRPSFPRETELRYVQGLFDYRLTQQGRRQFAEIEWAITPDADRTGIRLTSKGAGSLEFVPREAPFGAGSDPSNVVDAGYPMGSIQVPSGVEPIVLARDVVTAGGYFTVGAVITADLDVLGQCATHSRVSFVPLSFDDATAARHDRARQTQRALESLA